jgi:hypothetical protein
MLMAMGTTIAGVLLTSDQVFAFNVGDSRVYTQGPNGLRQVSIDDRPPLARSQGDTAIVTQTLGGGLTYADVEPHVSAFPQSTDPQRHGRRGCGGPAVADHLEDATTRLAPGILPSAGFELISSRR